ncbi:hypothetical protein [Chondromyces apiculatus]|uniref:Methyl-accepting chemotaxis sensory transducer n=1 Tax=Chondromyces apiculatus DSM 436 TaxID=1192034 RepID=A0A017T5I6_9BACT|nr:hypothetical protein [Chondromyces apiculatus]EYF04277.1 methyl-accepting chemotaxis sensory transducer [Chondromyces apiculatus DSM 436]
MPLDLAALSTYARERYLRIGHHFGPTEVLVQANKHLLALQTHAADLHHHGFGTADRAQLEDARDALQQALIARTRTRAMDYTTLHLHRGAIRQGRHQRRGARALLASAANHLHQTAGGDATDTALQIEGCLTHTARCPERDGESLALQLDVLRNMLLRPAVAAVTVDRGGPETVTDLTATITTLRTSNFQHVGTSAQSDTERVNVLEGMIVTLARSARKAAVAAGHRLGSEALAALFELSALYPPRATAKPEVAEPAAAKPEVAEPAAAEPAAAEPAAAEPAVVAVPVAQPSSEPPTISPAGAVQALMRSLTVVPAASRPGLTTSFTGADTGADGRYRTN